MLPSTFGTRARRVVQLFVLVAGVAADAAMVPAEGLAAGASITGVVVHADTGRPVAQARVDLVDTALTTTTDGEGRFVLHDVPEDRVQVRAAADGYDPATLEVAAQRAAGTARRTGTAATTGAAGTAGTAASTATGATAAGAATAGGTATTGGTNRRIELRLRPAAGRFSDTVVVSARRTEAHPSELPRSVSVLTAEDIARTFGRTTPEVLMDMPGVLVQKTNHGGGSPYIRGLVGNQVLVLVDGIRLNNSTFRYGPNQYLATIDVGQIERIEVVRGSGAVLYGSDAIGGVINIVTRRPALSRDGAVTFGGLGSSRFVSSGMERSGRVELGVSGVSAAVLGGVSVRDYGDLHAGGDLGVEAPSAYHELNGDGKALVRVGARHLLTIAGQYVHQDDVPRFDQVAQRGFSRYSFDPQVRRLGYARWQTLSDNDWMQSVTGTVSFHQSIEQRERQTRGSPVRIAERDDVQTFGASLDVRTAPRGGWSLVSGVEMTHDTIGSWRRDTDDITGITQTRRGLYPDDASASSVAAFVQGTWRWRRSVVDAGLRFSQYGVRTDDPLFGGVDISPRAWVGTVGVLQQVAAGVSLFGSISQGFRAPNVDDVSTLGVFDFGIEVPSAELEPERSVAFEAGVRARFAGVQGSVAAYRTNLSALIDRVRSTFDGLDMLEGQPVYRRANVGDAEVHGVEVEGDWRMSGRLTLFGHASYAYGQQTTSDQPLRRIPPVHGLAGARLTRVGPGWIEGTVRFAGKQDRLAPGDRDDHRIAPGGTPGWVVASVSGGFPIARALDFVLGVHNLFDEAYRIHGSGIDGYGRAAWVGTQVRF